MDAGLLNVSMTQTITRRHGDYVGSVKGNQVEVQTLLDEWIAPTILPPLAGAPTPLPVAEAEIAPPRRRPRRDRAEAMGEVRRELRQRRAPDAITIEKSRGRLEIREL
jgi:hypothetical protein